MHCTNFDYGIKNESLAREQYVQKNYNNLVVNYCPLDQFSVCRDSPDGFVTDQNEILQYGIHK